LASNFASPINIEGSTADDLALFLSIGWRRVVEEQARKEPKFGHSSFGYSKQSSGDSSDRYVSGHTQESGYLYVRLRPTLHLDDDFKRGSRINASSFAKIRDSTTDAVNNDEELRRELRRAAKELVRRRRARQKMEGRRWEVFVGNTAKADGDGKERS
jgi:hypothetical protein